MTITLLSFAQARDHFGSKRSIEVVDGASVATVVQQLLSEFPDSGELLSSCRFACDENIVETDYQLQEGEELAILPPSSGG